MLQKRFVGGRPCRRLGASFLIGFALIAAMSHPVFALITGGEGNSPLSDPGWPAGAAAIFNHPGRIAWWEGPPFGGGQWHAECRGDAQALNSVLADFARLPSKNKQVVLHDGVGFSFWLNPNREPAKRAAASIDWCFMVWVPERWERLRQLPADLRPADSYRADEEAPMQLNIYVGGQLRGTDVTVPEGLQIVDERLETHGYAPADGSVLEGVVIDAQTEHPLVARILLQRVEPQSQGGSEYVVTSEVLSDANGRWVLKQISPGVYRVVAEAKGYASRVIDYVRIDEQPRWSSRECELARAAAVSGRVVTVDGEPLEGVVVRLTNVVAGSHGRYETPDQDRALSDADGQFSLQNVPTGNATVRLDKADYFLPGLGPAIHLPAEEIQLVMHESASIRVRVDFAGTESPAEYLVHMEPEGGAAVGKWSGSGRIDHENCIIFRNVPPGRYVLWGAPNPSSAEQRSRSLPVELSAGPTTEVTLPP